MIKTVGLKSGHPKTVLKGIRILEQENEGAKPRGRRRGCQAARLSSRRPTGRYSCIMHDAICENCAKHERKNTRMITKNFGIAQRQRDGDKIEKKETR